MSGQGRWFMDVMAMMERSAVRKRIEALEGAAPKPHEATQLSKEEEWEKLATAIAKRAVSDGNVTLKEVAAFLRVSTKKVQRMEKRGILTRCPNMGAVVIFKARDVLALRPSGKGE